MNSEMSLNNAMECFNIHEEIEDTPMIEVTPMMEDITSLNTQDAAPVSEVHVTMTVARNDSPQISKKKNREENLLKWDWNDVIDVDSSDDETLTMKNVKRQKRNQISVFSRNKIYKLIDESEEDGYNFD